MRGTLYGSFAFIISHFLLVFLDSLRLPFLIFLFLGVLTEETLKIGTAKLADLNLYLVAFGFALAESIYYYLLFGNLVLINRIISTLAHLLFAWIYLRRGFATAILAHFLYNAYWML